MANENTVPVDKDRNDKKKSTPQLMTISQNKSWSQSGLEIKISVMVMSERYQNGVGRTINFRNPSTNAILATCLTNLQGEASHIINHNLVEVGDIIKNGGKKKVLVELIAKIGPSGREFEKRILQEVEIEISLPAGSTEKSWYAFQIRAPKHFGDLFTACLLIAVFILYTEYMGDKRNFNFIIIFSFIGLLYVWWRKTKSIFKTVLCTTFLLLSYIAISINPEAFSEPIKKGVTYSLFIGAPFYFLEELWRKPNGDSVKNCYPLWPLGLIFALILFLIFDIFGNFIPKSNQVYDIFSSNAFLNTSNPWHFLNSVPFLGHIDFHRIAWNIDQIIWLSTSFVILLVYGGSRELYDWFKSIKGGGKANVSTGGMAGIFLVVSEIWGYLKDIILPLLGKGKRR